MNQEVKINSDVGVGIPCLQMAVFIQVEVVEEDFACCTIKEQYTPAPVLGVLTPGTSSAVYSFSFVYIKEALISIANAQTH